MKNMVLASAMFLTGSASLLGASVFTQDFTTGSASSNLTSTTTTTGGYTWTANALYKTNGSYAWTAANQDFGAAIDLGTDFFSSQFSLGNDTVILSFGATSVSNGFLYAGFTSAFSTSARAQTNGTGIEIELRNYNNSNNGVKLHSHVSTTESRQDVTTDSVATGGLVTMMIKAGAGGFNDSTITVTSGANSASVANYDITTQRYLFLGTEAGSASGSMKMDSVSLTAIPEPSTYALAGSLVLAGLVALRRRRHQA